MLCDDCKKNEAVYHSIKIINGIKTERHLCAGCQGKAQAGQKPLLPGSAFSGFPGMLSDLAQRGGAPRGDKACTVCGTSGRQFLESGFLGCDRCYTELAEVLLPVIQRMQNGARHKGKTPRLYGGKPRPGEELERLKRELEKAVAAENFEEAMVLRDRIRVLRHEK